MESAIKVKNLDHLGIVGGIVDEIGIVELGGNSNVVIEL